tara:strand:+ start:22 stop:573 length:552 start_codon:yes stop_codon:yes gene_type:complete
MAYQKLQTSRTLPVVPSDTVPIPDASSEKSKSSLSVSAAVAGTLSYVGLGDNFEQIGVAVNDIVYVTDAGTGAISSFRVTAVNSGTDVSISPSVAGGFLSEARFFARETNGCVLYVGGTGNLLVRPAAAKDLPEFGATRAGQAANALFKNLPDASFLPVNVVQVYAGSALTQQTTATDIIALW